MNKNYTEEIESPDEAISFESYFRIKKTRLLWIIIAIAAFFRFYGISTESLWTDEIGTCWISNAPTFSELFQRAIVTQGQSPFYYMLEKIIISFLPVSEFSLRCLSFVCSLVCVFLIFKIAIELGNDALAALSSALVMTINQTMIYYAREARPYSLALMFALLSMFYFIKIINRAQRIDFLLYSIFSILMCYSHYVFASLMLAQNTYLAYLHFAKRKNLQEIFWRWISTQALIAVSLVIVFGQIAGILANRAAWNWLRVLNFKDAIWLFVSLFEPKTLVFLMICMGVFMFVDKENIFESLKTWKKDFFVLMFLWFIAPFAFVCIASYSLGVSLFDSRYLVVSILPFSILLGNFLCVFKSSILRVAFPGAYLLVYIGIVLIPVCAKNGSFSQRVGHDWKSALNYIYANWEEGDAVIMRFGEIKENWLPYPEQMSQKSYSTVVQYASSPFRIFYWKGSPDIPVYSLTYTWEEQFYPYYDFLFSELTKYKRIWILGVDPPNTNYPISNISKLLCRGFYWTKLRGMNFAGVKLNLLSSKYLPSEKKP